MPPSPAGPLRYGDAGLPIRRGPGICSPSDAFLYALTLSPTSNAHTRHEQVGEIVCAPRWAPPDISPEWASRALLFDVISRIVAPEETGAYVTQSHAHVVRVVDLRVWRSEFTALLALLRPRASVCVSGCGDSMTGLEVPFGPPLAPSL